MHPVLDVAFGEDTRMVCVISPDGFYLFNSMTFRLREA
jgi:hypothetical protein